jgi:RNA recognition motif-containing protein
MSTTVHVEGIAAQTTEKEVRDFFSFCGKISNLSVTSTTNAADSTKSATVTFEKETAAKTALLLDNTQLGPAQVQVTSAASLSELAGSLPDEEHHVAQEDKPRSRIVAEYLAHGYVISDRIIEKAIALDKQHGVSNRFTAALTNFDSRYKATEKARGVDDKYAVTRSATNAWNSLNSYFDSALNNPTGQKLRKFYADGNKQVIDVHNEARHLANLKSGKSATGTHVEDSAADAVPASEEKTDDFAAPAGSSTSEKPTTS